MAQRLSERDQGVLLAVEEHRFLTSRQVERLHFHDHATALSSARTARRVLRRLDNLGLLRHLDRRVGGVRAGSSGYVWQLSAAGQRLLHDDADDTPFRAREPSPRLLDHYLAVADCHLALIEADRSNQLHLLSVQLEPASWRRYLGGGGEPRLVRPDLTAVTADGDYEDHWFLEVDLGTEHPPTVVRKCQAYLAYRAGGQEQAELGLFPRVIWQVPDERRLKRLEVAFTASKLDRALFRITTPETLVPMLAGGAS